MKITQKDGSLRWKVQLCENVRVNGVPKRKMVRHVGTAHRQEELERFQRLAAGMMESELASRQNYTPLFDSGNEVEKQFIPEPKIFLSTELVEEGRICEGPQEIYGSIFDDLKMNEILDEHQSEILKNVVLSRIVRPCSKRKTQEILERDFGFSTSLDSVYRMMGALEKNTEKAAKVVFDGTVGLLGSKVDVVFFDVTTLYFESVQDDDLRKFGFSKDQKFHSVQVVLALATTQDGLPIGYKLFPGNTSETKTLIACLNEWNQQIEIGQVVFVADRGMFSVANLVALSEAGYKFIVAAKLRSLPAVEKNKILSNVDFMQLPESSSSDSIFFKEFEHNFSQRLKVSEGKWQTNSVAGRLICTNSDSRKKKDKHDRDQILAKMAKILASDKNKDLNQKADSTKLISNSGYKKYAKYEGKKLAYVDEKKVSEDEKWDGLHGLFTNTNQSVSEVLDRYRGLWQIEETFRICKTDLKMRPVYHFSAKKIQAHISICFLSLSIVRNLQFKLKKAGYNLSIERVKEEIARVETTKIFDRASNRRYNLPSRISEIAESVYKVLGKKRKLTLRAK